MKMPKVDSFLGCMSLETGGLVIGWLSVIGYFFSFLIGGICLIFLSIFDCKVLNKALKKNRGLYKGGSLYEDAGLDNGSLYENAGLAKVDGLYEDDGLSEDGMFMCSFGRVYLILFCAFIIMLSIGVIVISYLCIKGTYRRNHIHVKPMMILMAVVTILSFLDIFEPYYTSFGTAVAETILSGYQFIVLYSLYNKFLTEFTNGPTAYFQAPVPPAYFPAPMEKAYFPAPTEKAYFQAPIEKV